MQYVHTHTAVHIRETYGQCTYVRMCKYICLTYVHIRTLVFIYVHIRTVRFTDVDWCGYTRYPPITHRWKCKCRIRKARPAERSVVRSTHQLPVGSLQVQVKGLLVTISARRRTPPPHGERLALGMLAVYVGPAKSMGTGEPQVVTAHTPDHGPHALRL